MTEEDINRVRAYLDEQPMPKIRAHFMGVSIEHFNHEQLLKVIHRFCDQYEEQIRTYKLNPFKGL